MTEVTTTREETATDDEAMTMVVTLKSGVQIRMQVDKFVVSRNGLERIVGLRWEGAGPSLTSIEYLNFDEVAAVHAEWAE